MRQEVYEQCTGMVRKWFVHTQCRQRKGKLKGIRVKYATNTSDGVLTERVAVMAQKGVQWRRQREELWHSINILQDRISNLG